MNSVAGYLFPLKKSCKKNPKRKGRASRDEEEIRREEQEKERSAGNRSEEVGKKHSFRSSNKKKRLKLPGGELKKNGEERGDGREVPSQIEVIVTLYHYGGRYKQEGRTP